MVLSFVRMAVTSALNCSVLCAHSLTSELTASSWRMKITAAARMTSAISGQVFILFLEEEDI